MPSLRVCVQWWRTWGTFPVFSWINAADCYRKGNYKEAERLYRYGIAQKSNHPAALSARLDLSYCLFKQRKITEALTELQSIITEFPNHREGYVRLCRIQLWLGRSIEASKTLSNSLTLFAGDPELIALNLFALVDQRAPREVFYEVLHKAKRTLEKTSNHKLLKIAHARSLYYIGECERGKAALQELALEEPALFDAVVGYAEILFEEKRFDESLRHLRRALHVSPNHPRVLSLFARIYLSESTFYNPEFSQQLAASACQSSSWASARDMHILAEAYLRAGDRLAALITASRAKELGSKADQEYPRGRTLDKLLESLIGESQSHSS